MGKGQGRIYSLVHEGSVVAAIQVRWVPGTHRRILDISRFCTLAGTSVVGGYSRLVSKAVKEESPVTIRTFVDRRYGMVFHLETSGWRLVRDDVSGKTGYASGLYKIWDCGQARWELDILS